MSPPNLERRCRRISASTPSRSRCGTPLVSHSTWQQQADQNRLTISIVGGTSGSGNRQRAMVARRGLPEALSDAPCGSIACQNMQLPASPTNCSSEARCHPGSASQNICQLLCRPSISSGCASRNSRTRLCCAGPVSTLGCEYIVMYDAYYRGYRGTAVDHSQTEKQPPRSATGSRYSVTPTPGLKFHWLV